MECQKDELILRKTLHRNTIYDDFNHIATTYADNIAVAHGSQQLTYRDISNLALQYDADIRLHANQDQSPVVVCLDRQDIRLFGIFLGIIKSGRPYFYLDPADPLTIRQAMIERLSPKCMIGETITTNDNQTASHSQQRSETCCLVQTSGTTMQPRVVRVSHRAIRHNVNHYQRTLNLTATDRLSLLTSPQFSAANSAIYGALLTGARLCPFSMKSNGLVELIEWIQREQITILQVTPSLFRLLAAYMPAHSLPSIRAIKLGGESVYAADVATFKKKFANHCMLVNGLGMSEVAGNLAHFIIQHDTCLPSDMTIVPVGKVLDGHEVTIVDDTGKPVATGEAGEIIVRSAFLADGYWDTTDPVAHTEVIELRTNDLGYFLADGSLVHLGRKDRLIKRHGFRVDLNLIESALMSIAGIKNAAVYFKAVDSNNELLIACVQLTDPISLDQDHILQALKTILPAYMMPQLIHFLPAFPLTRSGKINHRQTLANLKVARQNKIVVKPRNVLEQQLILLWQDIFKRDDIGVYDNFFELGGDSLRVMELIARLADELKLCYPISAMLTHQTIAQMVEDIQYNHDPQQTDTLQVSLLAMQENIEPKHSSLVFIPGGPMSEKQLLLVAGLLPYLTKNHRVYATKSNLLTNTLQLPDVDDIAASIADKLSAEFANDQPILIGECLACGFTLEVANHFAKKSGKTPLIILLNPWHPRLPMEGSRHEASVHLTQYYQLLKSCNPRPYSGTVHLILAQHQTRSETECVDWWRDKTKVACQSHLIPGDKQSYIRINRECVAHTINSIIQREFYAD